MRVLVAIAPQMYRETVAHAIRSRRPDVEVQTCPPEDLDRKLALLEPDFLVCHDAVPKARECVRNRVEVNYSDSLDATISETLRLRGSRISASSGCSRS